MNVTVNRAEFLAAAKRAAASRSPGPVNSSAWDSFPRPAASRI
mgnify:CR=1